MPSYDTSTVTGGYNQPIVDWVLGDSRTFVGDVLASTNPPPPGDQNLSDVYFTLKQSPGQSDANAIIQVHITQSANPAGQITADSSGVLAQVTINVVSANYESLAAVVAGTPYFWDIRGITAAGGFTFDIASGTVVWLPLITQTNKAGTPATFPNQGQPQFRGFSPANPQTISSNTTLFNIGDFYMNSHPTANGPAGWQCIGQGIPGVWIPFFLSPNSGGGVEPPFPILFIWGAAAPVAGGPYSQGTICWNTVPTLGLGVSGIIGWVCVTTGSPGVWAEFGVIGVNPT